MKVNIAARRVKGKVSAHLGSVEDIKLQQKEVTPTKDTQQVSADGDYNALSMVTVKPIPDEYIVPSGNQNITENGSYDIADKASVTVRVSSGDYTPILQDKSATPTKSQQTFNADEGFDGIGTFTVQAIPSEYIVPSGTKNITSNGTHDVADKASVDVNVPIPEGYIKPSGTKSITTNGTHDVKQYESISVNVPIPDGYIKPSGTIEITESGTYDVTDKASAVVNVPSGGNLVEYSGSTWLGSGIAIEETGAFTINVGVEIPEKYHFYAMNWAVATGEDNRVPEIMRSSDGSCRVLKIVASYNGANTFYNIRLFDVDSNCVSVSADRRSITYTPPSGTTWTSGTWNWTLIAEG